MSEEKLDVEIVEHWLAEHTEGTGDRGVGRDRECVSCRDDWPCPFVRLARDWLRMRQKLANMEDLWGFELHDDGSMTAKAIGKTLKTLGDKAIREHVDRLTRELAEARRERDECLNEVRIRGIELDEARTSYCKAADERNHAERERDAAIANCKEVLDERDALRDELTGARPIVDFFRGLTNRPMLGAGTMEVMLDLIAAYDRVRIEARGVS